MNSDKYLIDNWKRFDRKVSIIHTTSPTELSVIIPIKKIIIWISNNLIASIKI